MDEGPTPLVKSVTFATFPVGVTVSYTDTNGSSVSKVIQSQTYNFTIAGEDEDQIRASLDTLSLLAPLNSDIDFEFVYYVLTESGFVYQYTHPVKVLAIADPPGISAMESILVRC